jgi:hypothetical protein
MTNQKNPETNAATQSDSTFWAENVGDISWSYVKTIVDTLHEPFIILDKKLCVLAANECFYEVFEVPAQETENVSLFKLGDGQWDIPQLRNLLEDILPKETYFKGFEVEHDFPNIGHKVMLLNAREVHLVKETSESKLQPIILLAIQDITDITHIAKSMSAKNTENKNNLAAKTTELEARVDELENLKETVSGLRTTIEELTEAIRTLNGFK